MVVVVVIIEWVGNVPVVVELASAHVRRMRLQVIVVRAHDVAVGWAPGGRVATVRAGHAVRVGRVRRAEIRVWMVVVRVHGSGCSNSGQFELFSAQRKNNEKINNKIHCESDLTKN